MSTSFQFWFISSCLLILVNILTVSAGCYKEDNIDYYGNDFPGSQVGSLGSVQACADLCGATPKCKFWTVFKADNYYCWLKTSNSGRNTGRPGKESVSGSKECARG